MQNKVTLKGCQSPSSSTLSRHLSVTPPPSPLVPRLWLSTRGRKVTCFLEWCLCFERAWLFLSLWLQSSPRGRNVHVQRGRLVFLLLAGLDLGLRLKLEDQTRGKGTCGSSFSWTSRHLCHSGRENLIFFGVIIPSP